MANISGPVLPLGVDQHNAVANGNYYCFARNQTGFSMVASLNSFLAGRPFFLFYNKSGPGGPSVYMDFLTLINTVQGTGATSVNCAGVLDFNTDRFHATGTGGTDFSGNISNPNGNFANNSCVRIIGPTAASLLGDQATTNKRTIFGDRTLWGTLPVVGDTVTLKFGGNNSIAVIATSGIMNATQNVPKVVIPPMGVFWFGIWAPGQITTASQYILEAGWIEA